MNFYGDFPNPRAKIRQKNYFEKKTTSSKKKTRSQIAKKSILGLKNNLNDYIISKKLISE